MTVTGPYPVVRTFAQKREEVSPHAVEKIRARAEFHGEQNGQREPESWICTPAPQRRPSQSGTGEDASFWDSPRLKPTFVAQVMGQVYCSNDNRPSAQAAYQRPAQPRPIFLDKKI